jgi:hypothetical protein
MSKINNNKEEGFSMKPSRDTIEYFNEIANKMDLYHKTVSTVKKYVAKKRITDASKISNIVIMSLVWTAFKIGDCLTETDILVILGSNQSTLNPSIMTLDPELSLLSLAQLMEMVNKAYDEKSK